MRKPNEKLIPDMYIPDVGSSVEALDGRDYLVTNDVM